jgi:hypothetical protein
MPNDDELEEYFVTKLRRAGTHIMGRSTYQNMAGYWPTSTELVYERGGYQAPPAGKTDRRDRHGRLGPCATRRERVDPEGCPERQSCRGT